MLRWWDSTERREGKIFPWQWGVANPIHRPRRAVCTFGARRHRWIITWWYTHVESSRSLSHETSLSPPLWLYICERCCWVAARVIKASCDALLDEEKPKTSPRFDWDYQVPTWKSPSFVITSTLYSWYSLDEIIRNASLKKNTPRSLHWTRS
jgi:hypothetical protein